MKFSIITVNYNNREGLRRTIESVAQQTLTDYELIVIDGGSTDGSADVLRELDAKISYWVSEPDGGIYQAMNKGIRRATGDYLNFMNSGDCFFAPDVLSRVAAYGSDADIIVGRDYHYDEQSGRGHASLQPPRVTMAHFFVSTLDHQSSFLRRSLFAGGHLYREDYRLVADWIFFLERVVSDECRVEFIPDVVCRREEGGLSDRQWQLNRQEIARFLAEYLPPGVLADYRTLAQLDKTSLYRLLDICDTPRKRRWLVRAIKAINYVF